GDDKCAVRLDRERRRIDDAARFEPNLHDLPHAGLMLVDAVDGVRTAIEYVVLTRAGLLKPDRIAKSADELGGNRADRTQGLSLARVWCRNGQNSCYRENEKTVQSLSTGRFRGWRSGRRTIAAGSFPRDRDSTPPAHP